MKRKKNGLAVLNRRREAPFRIERDAMLRKKTKGRYICSGNELETATQYGRCEKHMVYSTEGFQTPET